MTTAAAARVADSIEPRTSGRRPRRGRFGAVPSRTTGAIVLIVIGALFAVPVVALGWFSFTTASTGAFTLAHYAALFDPAQASNYSDLFAGIGNSLILAVIVVAIIVVLLLPAMLLAELRFPKVHRVLEFVCLIPITVPTIVLVVGFVPVYQVVQSVLCSGLSRNRLTRASSAISHRKTPITKAVARFRSSGDNSSTRAPCNNSSECPFPSPTKVKISKATRRAADTLA